MHLFARAFPAEGERGADREGQRGRQAGRQRHRPRQRREWEKARIKQRQSETETG